MDRKLSLRLPNDVYETLREEASKRGFSISDVAREKILRLTCRDSKETADPAFPQMELIIRQQNRERESSEQSSKQTSESDFAILETLFLLREFLFERNGQVLKKIDEKMERRFGKERKRIL